MSYDAALTYIEAYWPKIIHATPQDGGTLIGLPRPYLIPYGFRTEAREVRRRWCENCLQVFNQTGAFWEKYNVVDISAREVRQGIEQGVEQGVYGQLKGFGWSNAVFADFVRQGLA